MASTAKKAGKNAFINYLQASFQELRKVTWPTRNRAIRLTFLVLGFCVVVAFVLGILDYVFNTGYFQLISLGPDRAVPAAVETTPVTSSPITIGGEDTDSPITAEIVDESVVAEEAPSEEATDTDEAPAITVGEEEVIDAPTEDAAPAEDTETN